MHIVKTSLNSRSDAEKMMRSILLRKKAACCYIYQVRSNYWWGGELNEEEEYILEFKVGEGGSMKDDLMALIREGHPYDLPVIEVTRAEVGPDVDSWANDPGG